MNSFLATLKPRELTDEDTWKEIKLEEIENLYSLIWKIIVVGIKK